MLENAMRICEAKFGNLYCFDGEIAFVHVATRRGHPPKLAEFHRQRGPFRPIPGSSLDRVMRTKQVIHIADDRRRSRLPARCGQAWRRAIHRLRADAQGRRR